MIFGRDAANGRMRLTPLLRRLGIRLSKGASRALFEATHRTADELAHAAEATPFFALDAAPLCKFVTVHPLGGCPMSDDLRAVVVDDHGLVRNDERLLITDGSVLPPALGVNPSKTIAALAERSINHLIEQRPK